MALFKVFFKAITAKSSRIQSQLKEMDCVASR